MNLNNAVALILSITIGFSVSSPYCTLYCEEDRLTTTERSCKYPNLTPQLDCIPPSKWITIPPETELEILQLHNAYRSHIAQGLTVRLPLSSNMKELVWDAELAEIAQRWIYQCPNQEANICTPALNQREVGMVIGTYKDSGKNPETNQDVYHIPYWFFEGFNVGPPQLANYSFDLSTARFTQLVWADSERVGCARIRFVADDGFDRATLVCVYSPSGNRERQSVYKVGRMYSDCAVGFRKSSEYTGLCATGRRVHERAKYTVVMWMALVIVSGKFVLEAVVMI